MTLTSQNPHALCAGHDGEMSGPRYSILPARAVFDKRLTPSEKIILAAFGTYSDRDGWCFPSQKTLCERLDVSRSTLCAAIKKLSSPAIGYLEVRPRTSKGRGKIGNEYRVKTDLPDEIPLSVTSDIGRKKPMSSQSDNGSQGVEITPMSISPDIGPMSDQSDMPMSSQSDIVYKDERPQLERIQDKPVLTETSLQSGGSAFALTPPEPKADKRGTRMTEDWQPSPAVIKFAKSKGMVNGWGTATLEAFRDYWLGVPGAKGLKLNWDATFRNEVRKEIVAKRHKPDYGNAKPGKRKERAIKPMIYGG